MHTFAPLSPLSYSRIDIGQVDDYEQSYAIAARWNNSGEINTPKSRLVYMRTVYMLLIQKHTIK